MKQNTPEHPKLYDLMSVLDLPKYAAAGILELLWHFTSRFAPAGDVGRFNDQQIASALGWDRDPGILVRALIDTGWLDEDRSVHDWNVHCEDRVHIRLARKGLAFSNGNEPRKSRLSHSERVRTTNAQNAHEERTLRAPPYAIRHTPPPQNSSTSSVAVIAPVESNGGVRPKKFKNAEASAAADCLLAAAASQEHCKCEQTSEPASQQANKQAISSTAAALAKELDQKHPQRGSLRKAREAIEAEHLTDEQEQQMRVRHREYVAYYARAQPEFIPTLDRWIEDGDWLRAPPDQSQQRRPVSRMVRLAMELEAEQQQRAMGKAAG